MFEKYNKPKCVYLGGWGFKHIYTHRNQQLDWVGLLVGWLVGCFGSLVGWVFWLVWLFRFVSVVGWLGAWALVRVLRVAVSPSASDSVARWLH